MPNYWSFILCLSFCLLYLPFASAAPTVDSTGLAKRQNGSPITVVTVNTIQGSSGPITETCTVTLTPITVNGQQAFREERSCTQAPGSSNSNNTPATSSVDGSATTVASADSASATQQATTDLASATQQTTDSASVTLQSTIATDSASATRQSTASTDSNASPTSSATSEGQSSSTTVLTSGLVVPTDVSVIGVSSASTIPVDAQATPSPSSISSAAAAPTDVSVLGTSSMNAASASAAAAAALASTASAPGTSGTSAAFAIPGKQIQVLPIGLGVFAGVSVIALIVVGLVTYERTKYRKKFRKDKLAESAAPMGYGGMAERP